MANYIAPPPHERLNVFFDEFFRQIHKAPPQTYGQFLMRAEEEFKRLGYREKSSSGVENILIMRFDFIGDMVLTSGFLREVRANFPKARITLVAEPAVYSAVEFCPYVNEVLMFSRKSLANNFPDMLEQIVNFCRDNLWQKKFSLAFAPKPSGWKEPGVFMAWLSGALERIGYGTGDYRETPDKSPVKFSDLDRLLLTKIIVPPSYHLCYAERIFYVLSANGYKINSKHMELFYNEADSWRAQELLKTIPPNYKKVLLGLGATDLNRKYPVEMYLVALKEIVKKNVVFVIVGGNSEIEDANFIQENLPAEKVLNLAGKTTLRETEAIISQTDYYIGNVTGIMHMAAAAQIPVLTLYREAEEMDKISFGGEFKGFPPLQTKAIVLRPARRLGDCATLPTVYGGCCHVEPHCITQIPPEQIIACFEMLQTL